MSKKSFKFINLFSIKIFIMKFVLVRGLQNLKYAEKKQKFEIIKKKI
jgi:hypothetical protein